MPQAVNCKIRGMGIQENLRNSEKIESILVTSWPGLDRQTLLKDWESEKIENILVTSRLEVDEQKIQEDCESEKTLGVPPSVSRTSWWIVQKGYRFCLETGEVGEGPEFDNMLEEREDVDKIFKEEKERQEIC